LTANAEIRLGNNERLGNFCDELVQPTDILSHRPRHETLVVTPEKHQKWLEARKKSKQIPHWEKGADFDIEKPASFPQPDYSRYKSLSATEIFEQFIDTDIIEHIVVKTRRYALFLNCPDPNITAEEIRCFIAILYVSGYNNLPSKRHYWDSKNDMKNLAVSESMRRNRFLQICRFLHLANNIDINQNDKAWKIRPVMEMLKKNVLRNLFLNNILPTMKVW